MGSMVLPGYDLTIFLDLIISFLFLSLRVGAFILSGPGFGGRFVPLPVRIVATALITLPLLDRVLTPSLDELSQLSAIPLILNELIIGLAGGLILTILFGAASLAGDRIANTAGLGFAAQMDPSAGAPTPVIAQIFGLFLLVTFLTVDGHLIAFRMLLESYTFLPPGQFFASEALIVGGLSAGKIMFSYGVKIMLPIVATLLLINIIVGVFTRSAPQLNVFSFGFPITIGATIILLYLTVGNTAVVLELLTQSALDLLANTLEEADYGRK